LHALLNGFDDFPPLLSSQLVGGKCSTHSTEGLLVARVSFYLRYHLTGLQFSFPPSFPTSPRPLEKDTISTRRGTPQVPQATESGLPSKTATRAVRMVWPGLRIVLR
jgi:hypothetical protein